MTEDKYAMSENPPVGYGLPVWLDTALYLSADEVRALGSFEIGSRDRCAFPGCGLWPIEAAHIARKGAGGQKHDGPQILVCRDHHVTVDGHPEKLCFAIRRSDKAVGCLNLAGIFTVLASGYEVV